ncbi:MAG: DUF3575 domain-containing protein [Bacteroidales bacterium]|nr:DUF3575 domain-containing protein [Bacteroidales bacterium]
MKSKRIFLLLLLTLICMGASNRVSAQKVAIKTNLLYDAFATPSLGIEFGIGKQWTMDISGNYNGGWNPYGYAMYENLLVQPEFRYWFCNRFAGHFVAFHFHGGTYTIGNIPNEYIILGSNFYELTDYTFDGSFFGAGVAYGYDVVLGKHFNLELEMGFGFAYTTYLKLHNNTLSPANKKSQSHYYIGPTKASVALVYLF